MKWVKAPEELKSTVQALMEGVECEMKPMFGYPAYFINKNMFAGLFQDKLFLRLSPDQVTSLKKAFPDLSLLEPMPGRPMKDYHTIPEKLYKNSTKISRVIAEAAEHCRSLPAKAQKPRKKA
jgi:TfoX/Sxy family transcriptional regulator of competence genes